MATAGNTSSPTGADNTGNYRLAVSFVMPEAGTLTNISVWCRNGSGANNLVLGLFSNNAGVPGNLLASTGSVAEAVGGSLALSTGSASVALTSGTTYWIVVANNAAGGTSGNHVTGLLLFGGTLFYCAGNGFPADGTWNSQPDVGTDPAGNMTAYITYTPSGGGGGVTIPVFAHHYRQQAIQ